MRKYLRNVLILFFPILLMIGVNELSRIPIKANSNKNYGQETINSGRKVEEICTWACHNDTGYCKIHHVKFNPTFFRFTDPLYFGMIVSLRSFGNYGLANIFFLVLFFPFLIYSLLIKSLNIQDQINQVIEFAYWVYNYCTDFVINLANIFNLSYYEINFILFIILYPLLVSGAIFLFFIQKWRLKKLTR
jgi:hypothetical protein